MNAFAPCCNARPTSADRPCGLPFRYRRTREWRGQSDQPASCESYRHAVVALTGVTDFRTGSGAATSGSLR
jgi:hypothetical protein